MPDEPALSVDLGGVSVNDHTLADARLACDAWLDQTLARNIAVLAEAGATTLETVAQGGHAATRQRGRRLVPPRGDAAASFGRGEARVAALKQELGEDSSASRTREQAAHRQGSCSSSEFSISRRAECPSSMDGKMDLCRSI